MVMIEMLRTLARSVFRGPPCPACNGSGKQGKKDCSSCGGTGTATDWR